jgi:hypothetical protein
MCVSKQSLGLVIKRRSGNIETRHCVTSHWVSYRFDEFVEDVRIPEAAKLKPPIALRRVALGS